MKKLTFYFQTKGLPTKVNQMEWAEKFLPGPDKYLVWKGGKCSKTVTLTLLTFYQHVIYFMARTLQ